MEDAAAGGSAAILSFAEEEVARSEQTGQAYAIACYRQLQQLSLQAFRYEFWMTAVNWVQEALADFIRNATDSRCESPMLFLRLHLLGLVYQLH